MAVRRGWDPRGVWVDSSVLTFMSARVKRGKGGRKKHTPTVTIVKVKSCTSHFYYTIHYCYSKSQFTHQNHFVCYASNSLHRDSWPSANRVGFMSVYFLQLWRLENVLCDSSCFCKKGGSCLCWRSRSLLFKSVSWTPGAPWKLILKNDGEASVKRIMPTTTHVPLQLADVGEY